MAGSRSVRSALLFRGRRRHGDEADRAIQLGRVEAAGRVLVSDEFLIGEPVDEAAEWMETADGAFVWLTPSANDLQEAWGAERIAERVFDLEYPVPLRDGRTIESRVVNPLLGASSLRLETTEETTAERQMFDKLVAAFDDRQMLGDRAPSVDVAIKRQRSIAFFEAALRHYEDVVETEAAVRRAMWGGVDPLDDPSVLDRDE